MLHGLASSKQHESGFRFYSLKFIEKQWGVKSKFSTYEPTCLDIPDIPDIPLFPPKKFGLN